MNETIQLENAFGLNVYPKRDLVLVKGENAKVWDDEGREYVDCIAGHGVANIGHCHPKAIEAISEQARKLITCPGTFYNDTRARLLEKFVSVAPQNLTRAFLCNSGAESIEAAIKFARFVTGKTEIVCAMRGFHGRTMGALSATFNPKYRQKFNPLVPGFHFAPFNKFDKWADKITDKTAAVMVEIVQGEGGVHVGSADFFHDLQALCREKGILLIVDEIQTGFCRTGKFFACEHFDVQPDMMCVAKGVAGGLPMGAVLCAENIDIAKGQHGSTFGGNPLVCAAALAAMEVMLSENLAERASEKGRRIRQRLSAENLPKIREIRQIGLMIGIELKEKVQPHLQRLMDDGVLALPAGQTVLRLLPPLTISNEEANIVAEKILTILR
mgnify:CR=1 FL=1